MGEVDGKMGIRLSELYIEAVQGKIPQAAPVYMAAHVDYSKVRWGIWVNFSKFKSMFHLVPNFFLFFLLEVCIEQPFLHNNWFKHWLDWNLRLYIISMRLFPSHPGLLWLFVYSSQIILAVTWIRCWNISRWVCCSTLTSFGLMTAAMGSWESAGGSEIHVSIVFFCLCFFLVWGNDACIRTAFCRVICVFFFLL